MKPKRPLSPEDWDRAQAVFLAVLDIAAPERASFIERECGGNAAIAAEVRSLLDHDFGDDKLVDAFQTVAASLVAEPASAGGRTGSYELLSELGRGGMGVVYRATRADDAYRKQVAVKIVKRGMDTDAMLERFRRERQILANLDHPYIARLLDGGSYGGRPYLVMELVEGRPIDAYCREERLTIAGCCRLFLRVCEGVQYAHRNLVVHRDLKPTNILVTADGAPKILDFGVAKLLTAAGDEVATLTEAAARPLTPRYASPELILGGAATTSTDVYALSALFYEIVAGAPVHALPAETPETWARIICQAEPTRLPDAVRRQAGDLETILMKGLRKEPERRYSSVEQLAADITRYLEGRPVLARPDTFGYRAGKFVRRNRLAVAAGVVMAASLTAATALSVAWARKAESSLQAAEAARRNAEEARTNADAARAGAEREHVEAEKAAARAESQADAARREEARASQRLTQMVDLANRSLFDVHSQIENLPGAMPARRKLVHTTLEFLEKLEKDAGADPRLTLPLASAWWRIGDVQGGVNTPSLGDRHDALKSYAKAEALLAPVIARRPRTPEALRTWIGVLRGQALVESALSRTGEAEKLLERALPYAAELAAARPGDVSHAALVEQLCFVVQYTRPDDALAYARQALAEYEKAEAAATDTAARAGTASTHSQLAGLYRRRGDYSAAIDNLRRAERIEEDLVLQDPNHVEQKRELMIIYGKIAAVMSDPPNPASNVAAARGYYLKAADIARQLAAADPSSRIAKYDLASVELRLGTEAGGVTDRKESLELVARAAKAFEELAASEPQAVRYQANLAMARRTTGDRLRDEGRWDAALDEYRKALAASDAVIQASPADSSTFFQALLCEQRIAGVLAHKGDRTGAIEWARRAVERSERRPAERADFRNRRAAAYMTLARLQRDFGACAEAQHAVARAIEEWTVASLSLKSTPPWQKDLDRAREMASAGCETR